MADHAELRQQGVLDPAAAGLVEMRDAVAAGEVAGHGDGARGGDVRGGGEVVGHQHDPRRVEGPGGAHRRELLEGQGAGDVVEQHHVRPHRDDPALGRIPLHRMGGEDLLGDGPAGHARLRAPVLRPGGRDLANLSFRRMLERIIGERTRSEA